MSHDRGCLCGREKPYDDCTNPLCYQIVVPSTPAVKDATTGEISKATGRPVTRDKYCPECNAKVVRRARNPKGPSICAKGHAFDHNKALDRPYAMGGWVASGPTPIVEKKKPDPADDASIDIVSWLEINASENEYSGQVADAKKDDAKSHVHFHRTSRLREAAAVIESLRKQVEAKDRDIQELTCGDTTKVQHITCRRCGTRRDPNNIHSWCPQTIKRLHNNGMQGKVHDWDDRPRLQTPAAPTFKVRYLRKSAIGTHAYMVSYSVHGPAFGEGSVAAVPLDPQFPAGYIMPFAGEGDIPMGWEDVTEEVTQWLKGRVLL